MITRKLCIDTKNTIWHRSHIIIEGGTEQEIQEQINNINLNVVFLDYEEVESGYIYDTVENLPLSENQYNSTQELVEYTDKGMKTLKDNLQDIDKENVKMFSINDISDIWNSVYDEHFIEQYEDFYKELLKNVG